MKRAFKVSAWQRATYVVRAESAEEAVQLVEQPVERVGLVGMGAINSSGRKVEEITLEDLENSAPANPSLVV